MINKVNMRKVVAALRSGQFKQDQGRLARRLPDGTVAYCCMGVFCEVALADGLNLDVTDDHDSMGGPVKKFDTEILFLPPLVRDWAGLGLQEYDPRVEHHSELVRLSVINDEFRLPFTVVADLIEKHYKLLEDDGDAPGTD